MMKEFDDLPIEVCPKCNKRMHVVGKWCPCEDKEYLPTSQRDEPVDGFEKWFKSQEEQELTPHEWVQVAWQESAKQERKRIIGMIKEIPCDGDKQSYSYCCVNGFKKLADRIDKGE